MHKIEAERDDILERAVERSIEHAVFGGELGRRAFIARVGASTAAAALASVFPLGAARALAQEKAGPPEKKDLKVGFIPITCATPIIMAEPMGFYRKHGLSVQVTKASSWAMIRDLSINGETDATHMLSPMPLAISLGVGSQSVPYVMPAVENINGQAITLAMKHKAVKSPAEMKGFKFGVPFDFSMHNFLLRYYLAEGGVDPDKDVQIRAVPPPEMVANLRAGNLDGYLAPDPFNQRAVFEEVGFIHLLSKDIWPGHPCCAFAAKREFASSAPNTFRALLAAIVDATQYARDRKNRKEIAAAIAPKNFLNQPVEVLEQVLTGVFPDGLGDLDPHADEALGLPQDRRDIQEGGRGGVPGERVSRHPEGARLQGAGHGLGQARVRARQDEGLRSRPAGRLSQVVRDPEGVMRRDRLRVALYSLLIGAVLLGIWQAAVAGKPAGRSIPGPAAVAATAAHMLAHPFYDNGPNDKGIGLQLAASLGRMAIGYTIASVIAVSLGVVLGLSPVLYRAVNPYVQVLKPISPLAWMPLFLYTIRDSAQAAVLVIVMSSLWPTLANTAFGVASIKRDYLNVAAILQLSWPRRLVTVILPAAAPAIVAGLRISVGSAWVAIVAAEMLIGGTGIGYFVWNEWNNLALTSVIFAILAIGVIGVLLDAGLGRLSRRLAYTE